MQQCQHSFINIVKDYFVNVDKRFLLIKIMKLEIEEIAAQRSFIFLWCGSHEGLGKAERYIAAWQIID